MVLSTLSLTTPPSTIRFGIDDSLTRGLLAQHRLDAGDVAADLAHAAGLAELAASLLKAQVERFLAQVAQLFLELILGLGAQIGGLHGVLPQPSMPTRATNRVLIGSLAAASASASRATVTGTPSSSNRTRPGFTRAAQNSGAPLPEPMRTSAGFFETGTSGNTRIQTRPARFMWRVMARRAASIWRAVRRSGSIAFSPNEPKSRLNPPLAAPLMRPLKALRYLVRLGCSMIAYASLCSERSTRAGVRCGAASSARLSCAIGSCAMISPLNTHTFTPQVPKVVNAVAVP